MYHEISIWSLEYMLHPGTKFEDGMISVLDKVVLKFNWFFHFFL